MATYNIPDVDIANTIDFYITILADVGPVTFTRTDETDPAVNYKFVINWPDPDDKDVERVFKNLIFRLTTISIDQYIETA